MNSRFNNIFATLLVAAALLCVAPMSFAAGNAPPPTGAAYLAGSGNSSSPAADPFQGNGIPGPQSALDVAEPTAWAPMAFGLILLVSGCAWRRRDYGQT